MGNVQVAKFYHLFALPKYHVTLRACKDGGYREKGLMRERNNKSNFSEAAKKTLSRILPCYALLSDAFLHYWIPRL